jgi:hypothetical protein
MQRMASIMLHAIGFIDYLGYGTIFTRAMLCSVVGGQKWIIFPYQKDQDVCWKMVHYLSV